MPIRRSSERIAAQFEGDYQLHFHLAPPAVSHPDPVTGRIKKKAVRPVDDDGVPPAGEVEMACAAPPSICSRVREERKLERHLIAEYEALVAEILAGLSAANHATAVALAALPEQIRGYGHIKEGNVASVRKRQEELLASFRSPSPSTSRRAAE